VPGDEPPIIPTVAVLTTHVDPDSATSRANARDVLAIAIGASLNAPIPETKFGVFRM
jgi:3-methylcrotonyl-CoA carboxylase beta subunit